MPLHYADDSIDPISLLKVPERFIIFYSSVVDGEMWCPVRPGSGLQTRCALTKKNLLQDSRRVEKIVKDTFSATGPDGLIVYVGTRSQ